MPELGGYSEQVLARHWVRRPDAVDAQLAAALPAAGEAAARVIEEVSIAEGDRVLIVGAAGSVGLIATQLAIDRGARVLAAARATDFAILETLGTTPVVYGPDLEHEVRAQVASVDAVIDAAGTGVLAAAVNLAGGPERVLTLSDPRAADFNVRLSSPDDPRITGRLATLMDQLGQGRLRLRSADRVPSRRCRCGASRPGKRSTAHQGAALDRPLNHGPEIA